MEATRMTSRQFFSPGTQVRAGGDRVYGSLSYSSARLNRLRSMPSVIPTNRERSRGRARQLGGSRYCFDLLTGFMTREPLTEARRGL